jgi:hypothetical protein
VDDVVSAAFVGQLIGELANVPTVRTVGVVALAVCNTEEFASVDDVGVVDVPFLEV